MTTQVLTSQGHADHRTGAIPDLGRWVAIGCAASIAVAASLGLVSPRSGGGGAEHEFAPRTLHEVLGERTDGQTGSPVQASAAQHTRTNP